MLTHAIDLRLPDLPPAVEGLRIAHLSDLHIGMRRPRHRRIMRELDSLDADLVLLTGDYMNKPGDEQSALGVMRQITACLHPRLGVFGCFGNHDSPSLRRRFSDLPVHWLNNAAHQFDDLPILLMGLESDGFRDPDSIALLADLDRQGLSHGHDTWEQEAKSEVRSPKSAANPKSEIRNRKSEISPRPLQLMLSHYPMYLPTVADMGVDLMFSGHTHGGQWRVPFAGPFYNSSDLPMTLSSGILRHRRTLCVVSRGLGETWLPIRLFCPPQLPVYTLHRGPLPGQHTDRLENVQPW
ncbi:MAG: metallophosphoesterase [Phycisphaeraceae bacterium]